MVKEKRRQKSDVVSTIFFVGVVVFLVLALLDRWINIGFWDIALGCAVLVVGIAWRVLEAVEAKKPKE